MICCWQSLISDTGPAVFIQVNVFPPVRKSSQDEVQLDTKVILKMKSCLLKDPGDKSCTNLTQLKSAIQLRGSDTTLDLLFKYVHLNDFATVFETTEIPRTTFQM